MKKNTIALGLSAGLLLASCAVKNYTKTDDGVLIALKPTTENQLRTLRLQVLGNDLIHVAAAAQEFQKDSSLIIVPNQQKVPFHINQSKDSIQLSTKTLNVVVSSKDGGIKFKDKNGKILLAEKAGGGRTFLPIQADQTKGYTVRQIFDSPQDEAFYGLGQHQSDEFNYKDKSEELFQYNTKVSVPFVVSNKNYGLLWDSYSLSRFGDSRPYEQLNQVFKLFGKNGEPGFLTGTYSTPEKKNASLIREEKSIFFEDVKSIKNLPTELHLKNANVTYEGEIEAPQDGEYKFILYYSGYVKVYLDNQLVVAERWRTAWNPNSYKFSMNLKANKRTALRIEW